MHPKEKEQQKIIEDIQEFFGDTSVSKTETLEMLEEIKDEIDSMIEILKLEIENE